MYPRLETYDTDASESRQIMCSDGVYLYSKKSAGNSVVQRALPGVGSGAMTWIDMGNTASLNANYHIRNIHATGVPDCLLIEVYITSEGGNFHLLRTLDGGSTFEKVFEFGDGNGTAGADTMAVRTFGKMCVLERNLPGGSGIGDGYFGEYNVNGLRTAGSTNDRVRLFKVSDMAGSITFTPITNFNTSGHQTRHCHTVRQDPYTGYLYWMFGDNDPAAEYPDSECAIVRWDGSASWPDNTEWSDLNALAGFKACYGTQKHRVADCLFTASYVFAMADTPASDTTNQGIWRWDKDLQNTPSRVYVLPSTYDGKTIGWWGCSLRGKMLFTVSCGSNWTIQPDLPIIASDDNGLGWFEAGILYTTTNATTLPTTVGVNPSEIFVFNNKAYLYSGYLAQTPGTVIIEFSGTVPHSDYLPIVVWPVNFVGAWDGVTPTDSNNGFSRRTPKATVMGAVGSSNNSITGGVRVRVLQGEYVETAGVACNWDDAISFYNWTRPVIIEGQGSDPSETIIKVPDGAAVDVWFANPTYTKNLPVILRNIYTYGKYRKTISFASAGMKVHAQDCIIGPAGNYPTTGQAVVINANNCVFHTKRCKFQGARTDSYWCLETALSGVVHKHEHFLMDLPLSGTGAFTRRSTGGSFELYKGVFLGGKSASGLVLILLGVDVQPQIQGNIFSVVNGAVPIQNNSALVTDGIHHNCYYGGAANVNVAGDSDSITSNPLLTSDYHLRPDSPCLGAGAKIPGITKDAENNPIFPPYNIGPYGLAAGALGVATVANNGPPRNNITRLTGTSATINPTNTYEFSDTNAWRVVTGWTAGVANFGFDADGVPIPFTGQQLIDAGVGYKLYCGSKGVAGYVVDQDAPTNAKIIKILKVPTYIDTLYWADYQEFNWEPTSGE